MRQCKYGDPTCPCQDGDQCHYAGYQAMGVPPHLVDRLIELHGRDMNEQMTRSHKIAADARASLQMQLTKAVGDLLELRAELRSSEARLAGVQAYADGLASGDPRGLGVRLSDIARDLNTILKAGTLE